VVSSDRLIDALWGEQPPASAVKTLQTYVSQLRRELEPEARAGAWRALQTVDGGYRLQVDRHGLDADRFARLVETGRRALGRGEPAAAASWLREGLALWRGPAYGELAGTSAGQAEAAGLEELRLVALEGRVDAELGLGRHAELVGELEELVVTEPFRERLWSQLMLALDRSGRQAEALDAYGRLRGRLVEQLGIDPGPELRGLQERILRQDPSLDLAAPAARRRDDRPRLPPVFAVTPPAPLVGRDAELGRLRREWERAKAGERRLVVVAGEAGIGKSRLAAELARLVLADGGKVLVGHADDEAPAPYQPFVEALGQHDGLVEAISRLPEGLRWRLARLLPEAVPGHPALPEPQDQELDRFRLLEAMAALLAELARAAPLLLVLEDLHWADHATLALLLHLARAPVQAPLLVLATCREEGRAAPRLLAHTLAELRRHRLAELTTVRALDQAGIDGLVAGYLRQRPPARFTASIGRAADGNPFFVEELLRHLLETGAVDPGSGRWPQAATAERLEVPEAVREVLAQRLARLPAATAELLGVAAVLGREFEFTLLGRITGWDDEPILEGVEAALRAGILSEGGTSWEASYSFRHALLRQALYATLSLPRRQRLHLRAAEAVQAAGPTDAARVAAVALHLRLAGPLADPAEAVELSLRASEAAEGVYAWDDAVTHLRAAVDLLDRAGGPPAERARLTERLGDLMYRAGVDLEEAIGHLERALAGYLAVGDEQAAARARSRLGMHLTTYPGTADIAAALAQFQAAEAVIARRPARRSLGYLYVGMASAATFGLRTERLEAASRQAPELAEALGDDRLAGWAAYQRAWWAFNRGRLAESLALHERGPRHRRAPGRRPDGRLGGVRAGPPERHLPGRPRHRRGLMQPGPGAAGPWRCRTWRRSPGSATTCSTTSATPGAAAAGSTRPAGSPRASTRAPCWNACCCTGRGSGSRPRRRGRRPGTATSGPATAWTAPSTPTGSAGCGDCSARPRRPRRPSATAWRWRWRDRRSRPRRCSAPSWPSSAWRPAGSRRPGRSSPAARRSCEPARTGAGGPGGSPWPPGWSPPPTAGPRRRPPP
jgi:DNA-binding SARP family transcriptional activator/energy-coupling factor transporter ATP-binding protein EcfA2